MAEVVESLLTYRVDQGSVAAAVSANEKVALSLQEAQEAAASVGLTTQEFISRTGAVIVEQEAAASAIRGTVEATRELTVQTEAAAEAQTKLASSGSGISAQRVGSRVAGLGAIVGSQGGGQGFRDVSQLVMLGASFGAVGVAAGVLAVGMRALSVETEKASNAVLAQIHAQQEVTQFLKDATHDALVAARDEATAQVTQLQADLVAEGQTQIPVTADALLGLLTQGLIGGGALEGVHQAEGETNALLAAAQVKLEAYNQALEDDATFSSDAAVALQALSESQLAATEATIDAEKLTSAERDKKVAEMQAEKEQYQHLIDYGYLSQDMIDELNGKIQALTDAQAAYNGVLETQADIVERLNRQAEGISQMMDAITAETEAEEALRDAHQKIADDERETTREIERIRADEAEKETADRDKAARDRTKAIAKTADDEEKALRSHLEKLADIEDRYNIDSQTAEGDRSALGLLHAQETHDKALKDENQSYNDRLDDLQKALDDQLDAIQEGLDDQLQAERDAAQKQIANVIEKEERILEEDRRALAEREVDLINANATLAAIQQTNYSGLEMAAVNHSNNMIGIMEFQYSMLESRASQFFQNITGGSGASQVVGQAVEDSLWAILRGAGIIG